MYQQQWSVTKLTTDTQMLLKTTHKDLNTKDSYIFSENEAQFFCKLKLPAARSGMSSGPINIWRFQLSYS